MEPARREAFEARLAEYTSVRDEMIGAISNQHLVLTFGTAIVVAAFAAGITTARGHDSPLIFFAIPFISSWIFGMWFGEVVRMLRAVAFSTEQAELINSSAGMNVVRWEIWRQADASRTNTWSYVAVGAFVLSTAFGADVAGVILSYQLHWSWAAIWAIGAVTVVYGGLIGFAALKTFLRWKTLTVGRLPWVDKFAAALGLADVSPLDGRERGDVIRLFAAHGYHGTIRLARGVTNNQRVFVIPHSNLDGLTSSSTLTLELEDALGLKVRIVGDGPAWSKGSSSL